MYAKHKDNTSIECFYVGVATTSIYTRLNQHLCGDISHIKSRAPGGKQDAYIWLSKACEVVICYAAIQHGNHEKSKRRLEMLEHCLTGLLRPKFLILTAQ